MRIIFALGALALVSACNFNLSGGNNQAAAADGCQATHSEAWRPLSGTEFSVEAATSGPSCTQAIATITVRDVQGDILWTNVYPTAQVMQLAGAQDLAAMQTALDEWVDTERQQFANSQALPDWPQGAERPDAGEFPFYVDESLDRANYLALRSRGVPVFCYVQGMESLNCLALENGIMTPIGLQTFPG